MTIASVASGKGGAGKTSIAAALAVAIAAVPGEKCVFADCDVDAANGAIALDASEKERSPYFAGSGFSIDAKVCNACGHCVSACRFDAIRKSADNQSYAIVPELCERCGACMDTCPGRAISTYEKQAGEFFVADTAQGPALVYAELEPGEDTSGKLV
ncbi:MAG: 4Fe-4S binding protein, partial [Candidatus Shapirobacteria bacterium]